MKIKFALLAFFFLLSSAKGQTILNVGPGQTYTTIGSAYAAIPGTITGPYIIKLMSGYAAAAETFPITLGFRSGMNVNNTITLLPDTAGIVIESASGNGTLRIDSGQYIIIDGRIGGFGNARNMKIINSNSSGFAVQFTNSSSNCRLQYCMITGVDTSLTSGVVAFSDGNNSHIVVSNNVINGDSTQPAKNLVYSSSSNGMNSFNTIEYNELFNFYESSYGSAVHIASNNSYWYIKHNSIYETNTFIVVPDNFNQNKFNVIWIDKPMGNHFEIEGNYIGGSEAYADGTPLSFNVSAGHFEFNCINIFQTDTGDSVFISNNIIRNIYITTNEFLSDNYLRGIWADDCDQTIEVTGNIMGDSTQNNVIVFHSNDTLTNFFRGIDGNINAVNNIISGIIVSGEGTRNFIGINAKNILHNVIGSYLIPHSIDFGSAILPEIEVFSAIQSSDSIIDNLISNLKINGSSSAYDANGINAPNTTAIINNNTIRNIVLTGSFKAITGEALHITRNKIDIISSTGGDELIGIYSDGQASTSPVEVLNNRVTELTNTGRVNGIKIQGDSVGNNFPCYIRNNFVGYLKSNYGTYTTYHEMAAVVAICLYDYFTEHHVDSNQIYHLHGTSNHEPLIYGILVIPKFNAQLVSVDYNQVRDLLNPGDLSDTIMKYSMNGILVFNYDSLSFSNRPHTNYSISHNVVDSLYCSGVGSANVGALNLTTALSNFVMSHNTISNIGSYSRQDVSVKGISTDIFSVQPDTVLAADISYNTINNLFQFSTDTSTIKTVSGISYFTNSVQVHTNSNVTITNNFIHGIDMFSSMNTSKMRGIHCGFGGDFYNNLISLGINPDGNPVSNDIGIYGFENTASQNSNFDYNTVYIGGSTGNQIANTAAYYRSTTSNFDSLLNNILINKRYNLSGPGRNFCMFLTSQLNITTNFNLYYANGFGSALATANGVTPLYTLADLQNAIIGQNLNSVVGDPLLVNPENPNVPYDMAPYTVSPAVSAGLSIPAVMIDYFGDNRSAFPTIGAIETPQIVSVENPDRTSGLNVYPNPALSGSSVIINPDVLHGELVIYDLTGQEMIRKKIQETKISISLTGWPAGIYFIKLNTTQTGQVQKLVIQ